ncbi:hypothetical protein D3C80_1631270 [compost metagenome]
MPNKALSVRKVPDVSGTGFLTASEPATASMVITEKYRPMNITIPVEIFQNGVASPRPSNPEPLLAAEEVNSYKACVSP